MAPIIGGRHIGIIPLQEELGQPPHVPDLLTLSKTRGSPELLIPFTAFLSRLTNHVSPFPALSAFPSRSEKNLFRDRISNPSARRYSGDVDQVVQRKWTNHDVGIGRRYCVG